MNSDSFETRGGAPLPPAVTRRPPRPRVAGAFVPPYLVDPRSGQGRTLTPPAGQAAAEPAATDVVEESGEPASWADATLLPDAAYEAPLFAGTQLTPAAPPAPASAEDEPGAAAQDVWEAETLDDRPTFDLDATAAADDAAQWPAAAAADTWEPETVDDVAQWPAAAAADTWEPETADDVAQWPAAAEADTWEAETLDDRPTFDLDATAAADDAAQWPAAAEAAADELSWPADRRTGDDDATGGTMGHEDAAGHRDDDEISVEWVMPEAESVGDDNEGEAEAVSEADGPAPDEAAAAADVAADEETPAPDDELVVADVAYGVLALMSDADVMADDAGVADVDVAYGFLELVSVAGDAQVDEDTGSDAARDGDAVDAADAPGDELQQVAERVAERLEALAGEVRRRGLEALGTGAGGDDKARVDELSRLIAAVVAGFYGRDG